MVRIFRLDEPELFFRGGKKCIDPQVGLLSYGPHGASSSGEDSPLTVRAGVIATERGVSAVRLWLERLGYRINPEDQPGDDQQYAGGE